MQSEIRDGMTVIAVLHAAREADLCLVVGTSAVVHPAAAVPEATRSAGGAVIEVNPDPTPLTPRADVSIRGKAAELLPDLLRTP